MAVTDAYATAADYRAVLGKSDTASDAAILVDLTAVSRYLDRRLGRHFTRDATDTARIFAAPASPFDPIPSGFISPADAAGSPGWARRVPIDDLVSVTSVIVDEDGDGLFDDVAWAATDYELWPLNAARGSEPRPYTALVAPSWSTKAGFGGGQRIQVTGIWGWPAVPAAIARATCHLAGMLRLESPRATSRITEVDQVIETSRAARDLLDDLIRRYGRGPVFA